MINPMELSGKNILVTGASSGIGRDTAIHLSKLGANLILVARNKEKLTETQEQLETGNHEIYPFDLTNIEGISEMFSDICSNKVINGLVHAAGIRSTIPLQVLSHKKVHETMLINYYSFIELSRNFMMKNNRKGGSIVAISSVVASIGAKGCTAYSASKGALESSIKSMASELYLKKIRINCVAPGWIQTEMYEQVEKSTGANMFQEIKNRQVLGLGKTIDVANSIAFLLSDAAALITGTTIMVDGGYSVL